jgi:hypothetical protein
VKPDRALIAFFLCAQLMGCTMTVGDRASSGESVEIEFGVVKRQQAISSDRAGEADLAGGYIGMANGQITAAAGSDVARRLASGRAYMYTITRTSGETITFATEKQFIVKGDCVAIERGFTVNLRMVPDSMCEGKSTKGKAKQLARSLSFAAEQCQQAKRQLMLAQSEDQLAQSSSQVEEACQYRR